MYNHVVLGGTFDGLHKGHKTILERAFAEGEFVTIGLTSEAYIKRFKKNKGISPFSHRYQALTKYLRTLKAADRATIVPLDNPWGPALLGDFDAILVTRDNISRAVEINSIRKERGLPFLFFVEVPLVKAEDRRDLSSTRLRKGEIDTNGRMVMPDSMRWELKIPLGTLLTGKAIREHIRKNRDNITVTVGDVTTSTLFSCGVKPTLAIVDLQVERKPYQSFDAYKFPKQYEVVRVTSGPGFIALKAIEAIQTWVIGIRRRKRMVLVVDGEEDLLTLPAITNAPVGSIVYYGSPPSTDRPGLVAVEVTPRKKKEVAELLEQFT
jgi:pantetheine-phosphate adenylyltransferase